MNVRFANEKNTYLVILKIRPININAFSLFVVDAKPKLFLVAQKVC